jgi:hypothetical protein
MRGALSAAAFLATGAFAGVAAAQPRGVPPAKTAPAARPSVALPAPREVPFDSVESARRQALTSYIGAHMRRENTAEVFGYVQAVLGLGFGVIGAGTLVYGNEPGFGGTALATGAVSTLLVGGSFFAPRDTRIDILQVNAQLVSGGAALSLGVGDFEDVPDISAFAGAGAAFTYSGLLAINLASRRTRTSTLRRHYAALEEGSATDRELDDIEEDFEQSEMPIPYQVLAIPYGVGAAVALAPAFDDGSSDNQRTWSYVFAGSMAVGCIASLLTQNLVPAYRDDLAGIQIAAGPTNVDVRYRF